MKAKEEIRTRIQSLEISIEQAYKTVLELNILEDAKASAKVRKLVVAICESKDEVGMVTFDFQMNISKLQLKL